MGGQNYYLLASLPGLGDWGTAPPLTPAKLRDCLAEAPGPRRLVDALLLGDDLLLRESALSGVDIEAEPAVLTPEQIRDEAPLPAELTIASEDTSRLVADVLWEAYYRHAAGVAGRGGSAFLAAWIGYEVALRNALAAARAKALDLDAEAYLVAADLADPDADVSAALAEWSAAADPLAALGVLDAARWRWLLDHEGWFTFRDDELAAYAAKLMLLCRWNRLDTAGQEPRHVPAVETTTPTE